MLYPTYLRRSDPFALMRSMMRDLDRGFWPPSRAAFPAVNVWQGPEAIATHSPLNLRVSNRAISRFQSKTTS